MSTVRRSALDPAMSLSVVAHRLATRYHGGIVAHHPSSATHRRHTKVLLCQSVVNKTAHFIVSTERLQIH